MPCLSLKHTSPSEKWILFSEALMSIFIPFLHHSDLRKYAYNERGDENIFTEQRESKKNNILCKDHPLSLRMGDFVIWKKILQEAAKMVESLCL